MTHHSLLELVQAGPRSFRLHCGVIPLNLQTQDFIFVFRDGGIQSMKFIDLPSKLFLRYGISIRVI